MVRPFPFVTLPFPLLLRLLLGIDVGFIVLNAAAVVAFDASLISRVPDMLKVTADLAAPEDFNYLKWLVIAVALIWVSIRDRWLAPVLWSLVFAMILVDDSFQVHEQLGGWLSNNVPFFEDMTLYGRDLGEVTVFGAMGLITLAIFAFLFTRKDPATRDMSKRYILIVLALGFFGVGLDAVHAVISQLTGASALATLLQQVFGMLEDGGEMVVGSLAVALTLAPSPPQMQLAT